MEKSVYARLAKALDQLPNGFPRTDSQVEIKILQKIFTPDEAGLACVLNGEFEPVEIIAAHHGSSVDEISKALFKMVRKGLVWLDRKPGETLFRLAPFIVGIYEAQVGSMDFEFARLVEEYMASGGAEGIMKPQPALHRVIPVQDTVNAEWILPYDDVRGILLEAKNFSVRDCICRLQQESLERKCDFPIKVCLSFSGVERPARDGDLSQDEALALLKQTEEVGLVHTVSNIVQGVGYVCNCCGCCCGILRGITDWGINESVAYANYYAVIDEQLCAGCGVCLDRCQVGAISEGEGFSVVDQQRCIGCGLCVSGCPNNVARLVLKPEPEIVNPPLNYGTWEHERIQWRMEVN